MHEPSTSLIPLRVRVGDSDDGASRDVELQFQCNWDVGIGGSVWTSGEILTAHLESQQSSYRSKFNDSIIVELGSGTGFVGLMAAACFSPSEVILTDLATHVDCMQANIDRNAHLVPSSVHVRAVELSWGSIAQEDALLGSLPRGIDIILGTDVAYLRELYEPLLHTLRRIANPNTLILFGMNRTDTDIEFFRRLEQDGFEYYKISDHLLPSEYRGKDFGLFRINQRQQRPVAT